MAHVVKVGGTYITKTRNHSTDLKQAKTFNSRHEAESLAWYLKGEVADVIVPPKPNPSWLKKEIQKQNGEEEAARERDRINRMRRKSD